MSSDKETDADTHPRPLRRPQKRAIETRAALLDSGIDLFSRHGYDGVSVRQLEECAGVKRGLVAYHFGDKETFWKQAVDRLFEFAQRGLLGDAPELNDLPPLEAARSVTRMFVRYSAQHPALNRLMMQESMSPSWRVNYLVDEHIRPLAAAISERFPAAADLLLGDADAHRYYLFVGASAFVFSAEEECKAMFGVSPREPDFVERHADLVLDMLLRHDAAK